ncbi:MAG: YcdB/YcdC domain-containing protein [Methanoregula sp.]
MSTRPDDPDATYLPARYRQQMNAKKQRRIYKKLVAVGIVFVVLIAACLLLSGMLSGPSSPTPIKSPVTPTPVITGQTPAPVVDVTVAVTPGYAMGAGISVLRSPDMLLLDNAVSFLRLDYPAETYRLISANLTDRYAGHLLYEFAIQPADLSQATGVMVFEDAVSGDPYTPGQENARIPPAKAQDLARKAFPAIQPDSVRVRYIASTDSGRTWNFALVKKSTPLVTGSLDAETGQISSFTLAIQNLGRPAEPVLDISTAQKNADRYISNQNGPVAINMSESRYSSLGSPSDPIAGQYLFTYNRIVNAIPCDIEGFFVGIDAVNGEITAYERHWNAPDIAFSTMSEQLVLKREATFAVLKQAKETYPESVNGLRIISAEIRWKDPQYSEITPRPGTIPLAWKVTFDDDVIRANRSAQPAVAWVDVQMGSILDFQYQH